MFESNPHLPTFQMSRGPTFTIRLLRSTLNIFILKSLRRIIRNLTVYFFSPFYQLCEILKLNTWNLTKKKFIYWTLKNLIQGIHLLSFPKHTISITFFPLLLEKRNISTIFINFIKHRILLLTMYFFSSVLFLYSQMKHFNFCIRYPKRSTQ